MHAAQGWLMGGTPPAGSGGSYQFTIDAVCGSVVATQQFTRTVDEAPAFTSKARATFRAGRPGTFTVSAHGFPAALFTAAGSPPGPALPPDGVLTVAPPAHAGGSYHVTIG